MSVTTTADERLNDAKDNIQSAIKNLSEIVIEECWGAEEFSSEFSATLRKALSEMIEVRESLK